MRIHILLPLLAVAINARPQVNVTLPGWKVANPFPEQHLRNDTQDLRTNKAASPEVLKDPIKLMTNHVSEMNATSLFTMDSRTPPKIKLHKKKQQERVETSHPGIAVPVDVDTFLETSTQKRTIIYRSENKAATTDSGISTWILLSGQSTTQKPPKKQPNIKITSSTVTSIVVDKNADIHTEKPSIVQTRKPVVQTEKHANVQTEKPVNIRTEKPVNINTEKPVKPTVKLIKPPTTKRPKLTTALPPTMQSTPQNSATKMQDKQQENNRIMTKVKASVLTNAVSNKNKTSSAPIGASVSISGVNTTTVVIKKTTAKDNSATKQNEVTTSENSESNYLLQPEAKDAVLDLTEKTTATTKRPRRPANGGSGNNNNNNNNNNKRKKNNTNKNRKRKPQAGEKNDNSTKVVTKEKPIGTQIYNYLSREVMPTVGVGLVGLMVTAGLASYFLYPFGGLRRAYDSATDRKDYYYDEYSAGGVAEEELIGKVIAGMPERGDYSHSYRTPLARRDSYKNEVNYNYRNTDPYYQLSHHDYQTVGIGSKIGYGRDVIAEHQKETGYTVDDGDMEKNRFVVGNVPKEFEQVTPIAVPEHGPRSMRSKRHAQNDEENEIFDYKYKPEKDKLNHAYQPNEPTKPNNPINEMSSATATTTESTTPPDTPLYYETEQPNIFSFLRNLLELKVRIGLDFLLKTTDSFSNYLRGVQQRVNNVLREHKSRSPSR